MSKIISAEGRQKEKVENRKEKKFLNSKINQKITATCANCYLAPTGLCLNRKIAYLFRGKMTTKIIFFC